MIYIHPELKYFIATDKKIVEEGFTLGHLVAGEKVGVGYPFIHNVYRISDQGELRFSYHYNEEISLCKSCSQFLS